MDIVYRKSDGKISSVFSHTSGVKQNVLPELDYIAIDLPPGVKPRNLEKSYYLDPTTKQLKKRPVLDILVDGDTIVIQKKGKGGKKIPGNEVVELNISQHMDLDDVKEKDGDIDPVFVKMDVQLQDGRYEFALQWITDSKLRDNIANVFVNHPLYICRTKPRKPIKRGPRKGVMQWLSSR